MKAVRKLFVSMELHLDASIDKLDNLAMNVQLDKEKSMDNTQEDEQEAIEGTVMDSNMLERVKAEIVYALMALELYEYRYNADAFENRDVGEVKQYRQGKFLG